MRAVFLLLISACTLFVIHYVIPQPNGAGDLAAIIAGTALIVFVAKGLHNDL